MPESKKNHVCYSNYEMQEILRDNNTKPGDYILVQGNNQLDVTKYVVVKTKTGRKTARYLANGSAANSTSYSGRLSNKTSYSRSKSRSTSGKNNKRRRSSSNSKNNKTMKKRKT